MTTVLTEDATLFGGHLSTLLPFAAFVLIMILPRVQAAAFRRALPRGRCGILLAAPCFS